MVTEQNRLLNFSLLLISLVLIVIILKELRALFIPLSVSLLIFLLVDDLIGFLIKKKVPKGLTVALIVLLVFAIFYLTGLIFYSGVASVVDKIPFYSAQINQHIVKLADLVNIPFKDVEKYVKTIEWAKIFNLERLGTYLSLLMSSFTSFLSYLVLILLFLFFLLMPKKSIVEIILQSTHPGRREYVRKTYEIIKAKTKKYLLIKTAVSLLTALVSGFFLAVLGSDFVLFFATTVFILNFIPTVGSIIATVAPLTLMFLKYGANWRFFTLTIALMATQFLIGNILEPTISGKMLRLSPLTILFALIFWGAVWSITGMFLAVPLTVALVIVLENIPKTQTLTRILKGE